MVANCQACSRALPINTDDVLLSFLPLSHSFERMAGYYMPTLFGGATIYFHQDIEAFALAAFRVIYVNLPEANHGHSDPDYLAGADMTMDSGGFFQKLVECHIVHDLPVYLR